MATKTTVLLIDDLDGSPAQETVQFALDGVRYELDLSAQNADRLREDLDRWVQAGRRVGGRRVRGTGPGIPAQADGAAPAQARRGGGSGQQLAEIRSWARENGFEVSDRGRLSGAVMTAWHAAQ